MKIYDVSIPIKNSMLVWPDKQDVNIERVKTFKKDGVRLTRFSFGSHTGTHIDAPNHFLENGISVDEIDLEKLIGECRVVDLTKIKSLQILPAHLKRLNVRKGDRIIFRTGNFSLLKKSSFPKEYVSLSEDAACFLVEKGVCLVGTDFLGIEKKGSPNHKVHKILLANSAVILEGLDLSEIKEGRYDLVCLPLKVVGADGSPARAILIKN